MSICELFYVHMVFCVKTGMGYVTKVFKVDDAGHRIVLIVDESGFPVDMPSRFLLSKIGSRSVRTVLNLGNNICQVLRWGEELGIDIEARIRDGYIFGITEIDSLVHYLSLNRRQVSKQKENAGKVVEFAGYVSASMLSQKIDAAKSYFETLGKLALEGRLITDPYYSQIGPAIQDLLASLDERKVKKTKKFRVGLNEAEQQFLLKVTHPLSEENPFTQRTKVRNYLIVKTLLLCGVRLGELLALKVENCILNGREPYLHFRQNLTKEKDPRRLPPDVKTLGRKIYITQDLAKEFDSYIMNERRARGRAARKAPSYVFLNTNVTPAPMTEGAIYHMVEHLREKFPDTLSGFHPHRLRHTFNDNLVIAFADSMPEEEFLKLQRWLNGWVDDSSQGGAYTVMTQEMRARRSLTEIQDSIMNGIHGPLKSPIINSTSFDDDIGM